MTSGLSPIWATLSSVMLRECRNAHSSFCSSRTAPTRRVVASSLGKNADHFCGPLDFAVEALEPIGRVQLRAMLRREGHVSQHVLLGVVHQFGQLRHRRSKLISDLAPLDRGGLRGFQGVRSGDQRGDDTVPAPPSMSDGIWGKCTRQRCQVALKTRDTVA